ncbi:MAG: IPExxxVDY family protein [Cyclobacteriaceae bacterium]
MAKKKLEAFADYNFILFGISSTFKEYKLAWNINQAMNIQLIKMPDIELPFVDGNVLVISNYKYNTQHSTTRLIKNKTDMAKKTGSIYLIPELQNFDYLILLEGFDNEPDFSLPKYKQSLQRLNGISFVQNFEVEKLKSRDNLIF